MEMDVEGSIGESFDAMCTSNLQYWGLIIFKITRFVLQLFILKQLDKMDIYLIALLVTPSAASISPSSSISTSTVISVRPGLIHGNRSPFQGLPV